MARQFSPQMKTENGFTANQHDRMWVVNHILGYHALPCVELCTVQLTLHNEREFMSQFAWGYAIINAAMFHVYLPTRRGVRPGDFTVFSLGAHGTYFEAMCARDAAVKHVASLSLQSGFQLGANYGVKIYHPVHAHAYEHTRNCACCFCEATATMFSASNEEVGLEELEVNCGSIHTSTAGLPCDPFLYK
jgi:hypothetical protein